MNPKTGRVEYQAYGDVYYVVIIDAGVSGSRVHAYKFFISEGGHDEGELILFSLRYLFIIIK